MIVLELVVYATLLFLFYQDLKYKAVYAWLFLVLFCCLGLYGYQQLSMKEMAFNFAINSAFLGLQIIALILYFSIKERRFNNIFKSSLGLGDLLFLWAVAVYLSPVNYLFFYLVSLILVVILSWLRGIKSAEKNMKIPLAGYQALLLTIWMLTDKLLGSISLTSDYWLLNYIKI